MNVKELIEALSKIKNQKKEVFTYNDGNLMRIWRVDCKIDRIELDLEDY